MNDASRSFAFHTADAEWATATAMVMYGFYHQWHDSIEHA